MGCQSNRGYLKVISLSEVAIDPFEYMQMGLIEELLNLVFYQVLDGYQCLGFYLQHDD